MGVLLGVLGVVGGLFLALAPILAWASLFMYRRLSRRLDAL